MEMASGGRSPSRQGIGIGSIWPPKLFGDGGGALLRFWKILRGSSLLGQDLIYRWTPSGRRCPRGRGGPQPRPLVNQVQRAPRTSDWAVLGLKRQLRKFPTTFATCDLLFDSSSVVKLKIFKILRRDIFQESQSPIPTRLLLRFCQFPSDFYTSKCKTRTMWTFATINGLFQINHKISIKTNGNGIKQAWIKNYRYVWHVSPVLSRRGPVVLMSTTRFYSCRQCWASKCWGL